MRIKQALPILFLCFPSIAQNSDTITCREAGGTSITWDVNSKKWNASADLKQGSSSITIANYKSKRPLLMGNLGNDTLTAVGDSTFVIVSEGGTVITWKIFFPSKSGPQKIFVVQTKSYDLLGAATFTALYECN